MWYLRVFKWSNVVGSAGNVRNIIDSGFSLLDTKMTIHILNEKKRYILLIRIIWSEELQLKLILQLLLLRLRLEKKRKCSFWRDLYKTVNNVISKYCKMVRGLVIFWLILFYGISTIVGYLMLNPFIYIYIYIYKVNDLSQGWPEGSLFNCYNI